MLPARPDEEGGNEEELRWKLPDLVIIDGGKGRVSAAKEVLDELGFHDVPLAGLASEICERRPRYGPPSTTCRAPARGGSGNPSGVRARAGGEDQDDARGVTSWRSDIPSAR